VQAAGAIDVECPAGGEQRVSVTAEESSPGDE